MPVLTNRNFMNDTRTYGYIRVSTKYQNEDRQKQAILKDGVLERDIYTDKISGKDFDRPEYRRMKENLRPGDRIVILDLDRLGRNYEEMAKEWRELTHERECDIIVINYPLLSTVQDKDSLDKRFLADMIFQLLSYVAEKEREEIKARQQEGIRAAKARGASFGRPRIKKPADFESVYLRVRNGEITNREAQHLLGLKPNTYYNFINERGSDDNEERP